MRPGTGGAGTNAPTLAIREDPPARWVAVGPKVEMRPLVEGPGVALVLYRIGPGARFAPHAHEFTELGVVVSGEGRFHYEGVVRTVREGDSFFIPPHGSHGFEVARDAHPVVMMNVTTSAHDISPGLSSSAMIRLAEQLVEPRSLSVRGPPRRASPPHASRRALEIALARRGQL